MSASTPRWGFSYFGGTVRGSLADEGGKFTGADRVLLDSVLAALETRNVAALPAPAAGLPPAPTVAKSLLPGNLRIDRQYSYAVTYVDDAGAESAPSPATTSTVVAPVPIPGIPQVETVTGGNLPIDVYEYALTATLNGAGETLLGPSITAQVIDNGERTVQVTMPVAASAQVLRIWRRGQAQGYYTYIGATRPSTDTIASIYPDTGAVVGAYDPFVQPPLNTVGVKGAIDVTVAPLPAGVASWRLYRTETPGVYTGTSLVKDVVESVNENGTGGSLLTWTDTGEAMTLGAPPVRDQALVNNFALAITTDVLPDPLGIPDGFPYIQIVQGKPLLWVMTAGAWKLVGGAEGGGAASSPILTSPGGNRYRPTVDENGAVSYVFTLEPGPPVRPNVSISGRTLTFTDPSQTSTAVAAEDFTISVFIGGSLAQLLPGQPGPTLVLPPSDDARVVYVQARNDQGLSQFAEATVTGGSAETGGGGGIIITPGDGGGGTPPASGVTPGTTNVQAHQAPGGAIIDQAQPLTGDSVYSWATTARTSMSPGEERLLPGDGRYRTWFKFELTGVPREITISGRPSTVGFPDADALNERDTVFDLYSAASGALTDDDLTSSVPTFVAQGDQEIGNVPRIKLTLNTGWYYVAAYAYDTAVTVSDQRLAIKGLDL